jgi:hypothetical protein
VSRPGLSPHWMPIETRIARKGGWVSGGPWRALNGKIVHAYDNIFSGDAYDIPREVALERMRLIGCPPDEWDAL